MSQKVTQAEYDTARTHLAQTVGRTAFFGKLASAGIVPRNDEEAYALLDMGDRLYEANMADEAKASEKTGSLIEYSLNMLDATLGSRPRTSNDLLTKQAAVACAETDGVLAAAMILVDAAA